MRRQTVFASSVEPAWDLRAALLLIAVQFGAQLVFLLIAMLVFSISATGEMITPEQQPPSMVVVVVGSAAYLFAGASVLELTRFLATRRGWPSFRAAIALRPSRLWPIGIAAALATALASDGLSLLLGKPIVPPEYRPIFANPASGVVFGLFTVAVPPVVEEVVFRGVLYPALARLYGPTGGILLSAAAFGLVHVFTYGLDWYIILLTGLTGLVLAALRAYTASLWPCIAAHAASNAYASLEGLLLPGLLGYWP